MDQSCCDSMKQFYEEKKRNNKKIMRIWCKCSDGVFISVLSGCNEFLYATRLCVFMCNQIRLIRVGSRCLDAV